MKSKNFLIPAAIIFITGCCSCSRQTPKTNSDNQKTPTTMLDTTLIKQLGADEYGMKQYALVFLKPGQAAQTDTAQAEETQKQHLKYLKNLMDKDIMLILGPVMEEASISGICIYNCNVAEAKKLAEADPGVTSGELTVEVHPWYGTAAIMKVPGIHKTIETKSFADMQ